MAALSRLLRALWFIVWQPRLAPAQPIVSRGERRDVDGVPVVTLEGNAYQRGWQQGYLLGAELREYQSRAWPYLQRRAADVLRIPVWLAALVTRPLLLLQGALLLPSIPADARAEIQGIADATGLPLPEIVLNAVAWEVLAATSRPPASRPTHCSEVAVAASRTDELGPLLGYNYDLMAEDDRVLVDFALFIVRPALGLSYVSANLIGSPGLNTAMNSSGLAFGWDNSYLKAREPAGSWSGSFMLTLRKLALQAGSVAQAADQLRREPRPQADICLLADHAGIGAVELAGTRSAVRSGEVIWSCNRLQSLVELDYLGCPGDARNQRYPQLAAELPRPVSVADVVAILRDQGAPCGRQIAEPTTCFSVVYAPRRNLLWISLVGAPAPHGRMLAFDGAGRRHAELDIAPLATS